MKKISRLVVLGVGLVCLLSLGGCASFLAPDDERDPASADRGYSNNSDDEGDCNTEECDAPRTGRVNTTSNDSADTVKDRIHTAMASRDVILGMSRSQVMQSWGQPVAREVAGNGSSGHERWHYGARYSLQGERIVIFENGRVAGWYH